ncbi:hypothetical protein [Leptolyngbya sp. 7M]|uniref:hypothetical protein n=1 Tax=Leptolyngbya sp. 7M TaxID=2812896 RepID=UPI001B8AF4D9|nr:hypothetical protein [Leptolyngbya sp. 7M]QYO64476.1 hypothetical protein JVX88_33165 [Leptolyngbya sp. 7M]
MQGFNALRRQVVLGRVSGVPVRADYRWFFVIGIMTLLIAASTMQISGEIGFPGALAVGLSVTLIFFISIFIHEFAHAAIARTENLEVVEIVLHFALEFHRFLKSRVLQSRFCSQDFEIII